MQRIVYNIETYINFFSVSVEDFNSTDTLYFEISERRNDFKEIVKFFNSLEFVIGFNNNGYDNILINYLLKNYNRLSTSPTIAINHELKDLNDLLSEDSNRERQGLNKINWDRYKKYLYNFPAKSIDIFLFWSKKLRISKKLSLNTLACTINYPLIQEQPIDVNKELTLKEFDIIGEHGSRNTNITRQLARLLVGEINLRLAAYKKYGFNCFSWDGVKLGYNILIHRYCKKTGLNEKEVKELRTTPTSVKLKDIIFDTVKFKPNENIKPYIYVLKKKQYQRYTSFYALLEYLKTLEVTGTKEIEVEAKFDGIRYDIKSGGLHSYHNAEIVKVEEDYIYEDWDVMSYYPTLGSEWAVVPKHLGSSFAEELGIIKEDRLELKRKGLGKSAEAELLKLSLNGGYYGNLNNEYTCMYDWSKTLTVTINGQLFLLMLCERLVEIGVRIDMCNTDGITIYYHKDLKDKVRGVIKEWESVTKMEMESVNYKKVVRANINNYMAIEDSGKVKEKGYFISKPLQDTFMELGRSHDFEIISKAIGAYFKDNISVDKFIKEHTNIYDFCASFKVDRQFKVLWNGQIQQRLNRFYASEKGAYLYKQKATSKEPENMLKDSAVKIFNRYEQREMKDYDINYGYYIQQARQIIYDFESNQGKLL